MPCKKYLHWPNFSIIIILNTIVQENTSSIRNSPIPCTDGISTLLHHSWLVNNIERWYLFITLWILFIVNHKYWYTIFLCTHKHCKDVILQTAWCGCIYICRVLQCMGWLVVTFHWLCNYSSHPCWNERELAASYVPI